MRFRRTSVFVHIALDHPSGFVVVDCALRRAGRRIACKGIRDFRNREIGQCLRIRRRSGGRIYIDTTRSDALEIAGYHLASVPTTYTFVEFGDHGIYTRCSRNLAVVQLARCIHEFVGAVYHFCTGVILTPRLRRCKRILIASRAVIRHNTSICHARRRTGFHIMRINGGIA